MPPRTRPPLQVADLPTTNGPWAQGEGLAMAEQAGAVLMQVKGVEGGRGGGLCKAGSWGWGTSKPFIPAWARGWPALTPSRLPWAISVLPCMQGKS